MKESTANPTTSHQPAPTKRKRRWRNGLAIAALILTLVVLPRVLAHGTAGFVGMTHAMERGGVMASHLLLRQPLGTSVTIDLFAADPEEGGELIATFEAVVGETSESAFAQQVEDAVMDAAFARITLGERTERIVLPSQDDTTTARQPGMRRALPRVDQALAVGDTVIVNVFANEADASPTTTLTFTQGRDSAAAFREAAEQAMRDAAVLEVTLPASTRTIDLQAMASRSGRRGVMTMPGAADRSMADRDGMAGAGFMRGGPRGEAHDHPRGHRY